MLYLLRLSVCLVLECSWYTYLMERLIQKQMNMSSGNFASFSGRIASCFFQSLSCFTRDRQKSLAVAIYNQTKSRNCQNFVKI